MFTARSFRVDFQISKGKTRFTEIITVLKRFQNLLQNTHNIFVKSLYERPTILPRLTTFRTLRFSFSTNSLNLNATFEFYETNRKSSNKKCGKTDRQLEKFSPNTCKYEWLKAYEGMAVWSHVIRPNTTSSTTICSSAYFAFLRSSLQPAIPIFLISKNRDVPLAQQRKQKLRVGINTTVEDTVFPRYETRTITTTTADLSLRHLIHSSLPLFLCLVLLTELFLYVVQPSRFYE